MTRFLSKWILELKILESLPKSDISLLVYLILSYRENALRDSLRPEARLPICVANVRNESRITARPERQGAFQ